MKLDNDNSELVRIPKSISTPSFLRRSSFKFSSSLDPAQDESLNETRIVNTRRSSITRISFLEPVQEKSSNDERPINSRRSSFSNLFSRDNIQKNRVGHDINKDCVDDKDPPTNEEININASSQKEKIIKHRQNNLRKVASMCNIFSKSNSEINLTEHFRQSKCCDDSSGKSYAPNGFHVDDSWNAEADLNFFTSMERESLRSSFDSIEELYPDYHTESSISMQKDPGLSMPSEDSSTLSGSSEGKKEEISSTVDYLDLSSSSMKHFIRKVLKEETRCEHKGIRRIGSLSDLFSSNKNVESALENLQKYQGNILQSIQSEDGNNDFSGSGDIEDSATEEKEKDWNLKNMFRKRQELSELEVELILSL